MAAWSPTIEGFRSIFRRPALPLAEVAWRWSFGAAAFVLIGLGVLEYLDSLPVSPTDMLMLRTGHPMLASSALSHIARGSGFVWSWHLCSCSRLSRSFGSCSRRSAARRRSMRSSATFANKRGPRSSKCRHRYRHTPTEVVEVSSGWRLRSLAGLHFLRAALALAACAGCLGALILAGFVSSKNHPQPASYSSLRLP